MSKKSDFLSEYDPSKDIPQKFQIGDKPCNLYENLNFTPTFCFKYISLNGKELCFNFNKINTKGYHKLFEKLKLLSSITFKELSSNSKFHKFHPVSFSDNITLSKHQYKKYLTNKPDELNDDQLPTLYQFEVFEEKRVMGFLGYYGLFFILIYDFNHNIYKRK